MRNQKKFVNKNCLIVLFPESAYLLSQKDCIPAFNQCIKQRYYDKGYEIVTVNYQSSPGFVMVPHHNVELDIPFVSAHDTHNTNYRAPNFIQIAQRLQPKRFAKIVVCGFHCFDCVAQLAESIYQYNAHIIVDTDLTEMFPTVSKQTNFEIATFKPDAKITEICDDGRFLPPTMLQKMVKRYTNPIWGISAKQIAQLKNLCAPELQTNQNREM